MPIIGAAGALAYAEKNTISNGVTTNRLRIIEYLPEDFNVSDTDRGLIIYFNGAGNGDSPDSTIESFGSEGLPLWLQSVGNDMPYIMAGVQVDDWGIFDNFTGGEVRDLIDWILLSYAPYIDDQKVIAMGYSWGGKSALEMAMQYPSDFCACVTISAANWAGNASNLAGVATYLFANTLDDLAPTANGTPSINAHNGVFAVSAHSALHKLVLITDDQSSGNNNHSIYHFLLNDPKFWRWLSLQRRGAHREVIINGSGVPDGDYRASIVKTASDEFVFNEVVTVASGTTSQQIPCEAGEKLKVFLTNGDAVTTATKYLVSYGEA